MKYSPSNRFRKLANKLFYTYLTSLALVVPSGLISFAGVASLGKMWDVKRKDGIYAESLSKVYRFT